ncbi:hypothetical protein F5I97DRAFT_1817939, partial [Phlebopus sp. FC_14]
TVIMDGNFKAEHMHDQTPCDQVFLIDGRGYMVVRDRYHEYLKNTNHSMEMAVNQANMNHHKLKDTGIGECACAHHGCFILHALVNFQKEENPHRQVNIDYALVNALQHNMNGVQWVLTFYDINCQYMKNLYKRIRDSTYL